MFTGKHPQWNTIFDKLHVQLCNFTRNKAPLQIFSCKFNEFFEKNYLNLDFAKVRCEDSGTS